MLSAKLPREEMPKKVADREARWLALAEERSPDVVPSLLAFEWPVHPREAKARMAELLGLSARSAHRRRAS